MDFFITETQLKKILSERDESKMSDYMKQLFSFTHDIVNRAMKTYNINLKMLLTWGTSVGGLMLPLKKWIEDGEFSLSDEQTALILSGVAFIMFFEGRRGLKLVLEKIKDEGLETEFSSVLSKTKKLKIAFEEFLWSLKFSVGTALDTVAYSFMIPIITDIYDIATKTTDDKQAAILIAERLLASGVVVVGKEVLTTLIRKLIKKFKGK